MSNLKIMKMTEADLEQVFEIEKESFPIPWPMSSFKEELNNVLANYIVAKDDEKVIAYMGMWFVMDECHIGNIAVSKDYRKQGVASTLIKQMLTLCKEHETRYVMLEVRATNFAAQNLYSKFGFKPEVIRKGYYKNPDDTHEDAIIMSMEL